MKLLKNRSFLIPAALVIMLAVGVASAFSDLKGAIRDTEQLYYDGVKAEKGNYLRPSIYSQMNFKYTTANGILGIVDGHPELETAAAALREAKNRVYDCMGAYDENTVRSMAAANGELMRAVKQLETALEDANLSERERKELDRCLKDMDGAQSVIEQSGYNEAVREFNSTKMSRFPAKQFLALFDRNSRGASYFEY